MDKTAVKSYLLSLQDNICATLEAIDGRAVFKEDKWEHVPQGGGRTRALSEGNVFEKAAVNFSHVCGDTLPKAATEKRPEIAGSAFEAMGLSLVLHPDNPYVPTTHMNVRFFITENKKGETVFWFGGGFDLTPYYAFQADCVHWHTVAKNACEPFGDEVYADFKAWCDNYFYLKHRDERRGIGGLFFDDLNAWGFDRSFDFMKNVGDHFLKAYLPIVEKRQQTPFTEREKNFQKYRRGRYVEFNLIYDRGTLFGLHAGGRTESILTSLPPEVIWRYNWEAETGTVEAALLDFLQPREWV